MTEVLMFFIGAIVGALVVLLYPLKEVQKAVIRSKNKPKIKYNSDEAAWKKENM